MAKTKPELRMEWSKRERDFVINFPSKPDGHLIYFWLCCKRVRRDVNGNVTEEHSLADQLEQRGYDLTTLRFSIRKKQGAGNG